MSARWSAQRPPLKKPSIEEVLDHYYGLTLTESKFWQKVFCPIHTETRASASVSTEAQRWCCHACDLSEDSISVIMREEEIGFNEAVKYADAWLSGVSEGVPKAVPGEPSGGVSSSPRTVGRRKRPATRIRRFGENGA